RLVVIRVASASKLDRGKGGGGVTLRYDAAGVAGGHAKPACPRPKSGSNTALAPNCFQHGAGRRPRSPVGGVRSSPGEERSSSPGSRATGSPGPAGPPGT